MFSLRRKIQLHRVFFCFALLAAPLAARADGVPVPLPKPAAVMMAAAATTPAVVPEPAAPEAAPIELAAFTPADRPETRLGNSGLPVPRFVSLKSGQVYMREGPSSDHKVEWVYVRRGLPVEIIAEYDVWRRIRDADGVTGWVHKQMLDGRRSVMMTGKGNVQLRDAASPEGAVIAYAQPGVIAKLKACNGNYCEVEAQSIDAYVARSQLYGVYENETVE